MDMTTQQTCKLCPAQKDTHWWSVLGHWFKRCYHITWTWQHNKPASCVLPMKTHTDGAYLATDLRGVTILHGMTPLHNKPASCVLPMKTHTDGVYLATDLRGVTILHGMTTQQTCKLCPAHEDTHWWSVLGHWFKRCHHITWNDNTTNLQVVSCPWRHTLMGRTWPVISSWRRWWWGGETRSRSPTCRVSRTRPAGCRNTCTTQPQSGRRTAPSWHLQQQANNNITLLFVYFIFILFLFFYFIYLLLYYYIYFIS